MISARTGQYCSPLVMPDDVLYALVAFPILFITGVTRSIAHRSREVVYVHTQIQCTLF